MLGCTPSLDGGAAAPVDGENIKANSTAIVSRAPADERNFIVAGSFLAEVHKSPVFGPASGKHGQFPNQTLLPPMAVRVRELPGMSTGPGIPATGCSPVAAPL